MCACRSMVTFIINLWKILFASWVSVIRTWRTVLSFSKIEIFLLTIFWSRTWSSSINDVCWHVSSPWLTITSYCSLIFMFVMSMIICFPVRSTNKWIGRIRRESSIRSKFKDWGIIWVFSLCSCDLLFIIFLFSLSFNFFCLSLS